MEKKLFIGIDFSKKTFADSSYKCNFFINVTNDSA